MKNLNTMKFISNAVSELNEYKVAIKTAETYDSAKNIARTAFGYLDCMTTFLNTMICAENNDFTEEFDEVLDGWMHKIYQAMVDKAIDTNQESDLIFKLLQKRDEYQPM